MPDPVALTAAPPFAHAAELLAAQAADRPHEEVYVFLDEDLEPHQRLTFAELERRAQAVAAALQRRSRPGDRVLMVYLPGLDFVAAFWGCLIAGRVAVTAYPPQPGRMRQSLPRLRAIVADAGATALLTESPLARALDECGEQMPELGRLDRELTDQLAPAAGSYREPALAGSDLAFLQYTSGSTSRPKGVMISHANLMANLASMTGRFGESERSISCCWLPSAHDMGLVEGILSAVFCRRLTYLMSPLTFLKRPSSWVEAISRFRANHCGAPNFAYDLSVRKTAPAQRSLLDLSCWRNAYNGAEPVRADTLERFTEAFAECGFQHRAHHPCYGLAEATLMVSGIGVEGEPRVLAVDGGALAGGHVKEVDPEAPHRRLVSTGPPIDGLEAAIVDPESGERREDGRVGEVWVRGTSIGAGYWQRTEESEGTFDARVVGDDGGGYLRTGDLGAMVGGDLVITGRIKDLIILDGRNIYPQDVEYSVERSHPAVRAGCVAAFAIERDGAERLGLAVEVRTSGSAAVGASDADDLMAAIRRAVAEEHEVRADRVALLAPGSLPKTSSGKLRRFAIRRGLDDGTLTTLAGEGW